MSKKINYTRLFKDTLTTLNPRNILDRGYNWLTKDVVTEDMFDVKNKGTTNQKIIFWLINPKKIDESLNARDFKVICNSINFPYHEDKEKLSLEIKNYIYSKKSLFSDVIIRYLEKLSISEMEQVYYFDNCTIVKKYFYIKEKESQTEQYRRNDLYSLFKKEFNKNVVRATSYEKRFETGKLEYNKIFEKFLTLYSAILSSDALSKEVDNLTKDIFKDTDNPYKFAVDQNYNLDKSLYGGPYHRLHDESHTVAGMYQKVKDAKPGDLQSEEFIAFINEYAKDLQTTMGLPIVNISKGSFDEIHSFIKPLGVSKNDLYDFVTYNLQEALNVVFLIAYYLFPSTRKNKDKLGYVYGMLTTVGVFGNPLAIITLAVVMVVSIIKEDFKDKNDKEKIIKGAFKGAGITLLIKFAIGVLDIDDISELIGFIVAMSMIILLVKKSKKKVDLDDFSDEVKKRLEKLKHLSENSISYQK